MYNWLNFDKKTFYLPSNTAQSFWRPFLFEPQRSKEWCCLLLTSLAWPRLGGKFPLPLPYGVKCPTSITTTNLLGHKKLSNARGMPGWDVDMSLFDRYINTTTFFGILDVVANESFKRGDNRKIVQNKPRGFCKKIYILCRSYQIGQYL